MGKSPELDQASINADNVPKATSPQDSPFTDDFGRIGIQPIDTEMQRLDNQQDSLPSTQAQVHHEIEANASSDRTVRYSDALTWKVF